MFEAFHALQTNSFDAVIVDWDSEQKEAKKILEFAESSNSLAIRYVVSGFDDRRAATQLASQVDQHFNPETDPREVVASIERALSLNAVIKNDETRLVVGQMSQIPSIPEVYSELMEDIEREESSAASTANILAKDVAMTAKTLQLANSAYFGREKQVADLRTAVRLIGFRTIASMALAAGVFQQLKAGVDEKLLETLWDHSTRVAKLARELASQVDPVLSDEAFTAGLLHEIGTVVIAANAPALYARLGEEVFMDDRLRAKKEKETFGATHSQIGAYLLGRWGIPDRIVDAVAYHHEPMAAETHEFTSLTAVHVADAIITANENQLESDFSEICDFEYIREIGAESRIPNWESHLKFVPEPVG